MISLGKLAAGLAHELNNPASATLRAAKSLLDNLAAADEASRALGSADLSHEFLDLILNTEELCGERPASSKLSPIDRIDREDQIADWLQEHRLNPDHSALLAETPVTLETLDSLARGAAQSNSLDIVLNWIATGCSIRSLAHDIERAATRIHELVAAIRNFTYMDKLAGAESVDIESGLRDTVLILAAKAKSKNVTITVDVAPDLPHAYANGGELNQVWLNLIDNALDAVPESGEIVIKAFQDLDRLVVSVLDNGSGISPEIASHVFDPFFTTKPLGQGTGLGLDIVWRLLRRYQGEVSFESQPGRTEFRVSLLIEKSDPGSFSE
ncbi:MAG: ATP-binding protein [Acidobacteriota bacterium]